MPFFETTMQQMQAFRQLQRARQEGCSPVALTGCAMVQKAQLALTLSSPEQPVLILTGEEAEAWISYAVFAVVSACCVPVSHADVLARSAFRVVCAVLWRRLSVSC